MSHPAATRRAHHPWRWVAGAVALLLVVVTVGGVLVYRHLQGNLTTVDVAGALGTARPSKAPAAAAAASQPLNILVMGSDTRAGQGSEYGSASVIAGARSDTAMLVHLYADRQRALVLSIPRDTWTQIPSCPLPGGKTAQPSEQRFNAAFGIGGPACSIKTLEALTGIYVDHFVVVDFDGFKKLVDALGGVKVCLNESVDDPKSKLVLSAGTHVVTGDTALAFVRARETLGDGSDIGRISRQQAFLSSMVQEVKSTSLLLDPVRLFKVLDAATASITTDPGLGSLNALRKLAQGVAGIAPSRVTFVTLPWKPRGDGATVVVNEAEAQQIFDAIKNDAPWPAADGQHREPVQLAAEDRAERRARAGAERHRDGGPGHRGRRRADEAGLRRRRHRHGERGQRRHDGALLTGVRRVRPHPDRRGEGGRRRGGPGARQRAGAGGRDRLQRRAGGHRARRVAVGVGVQPVGCGQHLLLS